KVLPVTFVTMLIGTIAISGIPPFAGFFSKDEILAHAFQHQPMLWAIGFLTALCTAFYMFRLLYLTFFGKFRGTEEQKKQLHESPWQMTVPLIVLAVLSVVGGFINIPEALGGNHSLGAFLAPICEAGSAHAETLSLSHSTEYLLMGVSAGGALIMAFVAYNRYVKEQTVPAADTEASRGLHKLSYRKAYVDEIYDAIIVQPLKKLSVGLYKYVDRMGIDGFVNGVGDFFVSTGKGLRQLQSGHVGFYILMMVISVIVILLYAILM